MKHFKETFKEISINEHINRTFFLKDMEWEENKKSIISPDVTNNQNHVFSSNIQNKEQIDHLLKDILTDLTKKSIFSFSISKEQKLFSFCDDPKVLQYINNYFSLNWKKIHYDSSSCPTYLKKIFIILDLFTNENYDPIQNTDFFSLFFAARNNPETYLLFISLVLRLKTKFSSPIFFFRDISYSICCDLCTLFQSKEVDNFLSYLKVPKNEENQDEQPFDTSSPAYCRQEDFLKFLMISLKKKILKPKYFSFIIEVISKSFVLTNYLFFKDQRYSIQYVVIRTLFSYNETFRPIILFDYLDMIGNQSYEYDSTNNIIEFAHFILENLNNSDCNIQSEDLEELLVIVGNCMKRIARNKPNFKLLKSQNNFSKYDRRTIENFYRLIQSNDPIEFRNFITKNSKHGYDPITFKITNRPLTPNDALISFQQIQIILKEILSRN